MIPVYLKISGFLSYRDPVEIDFSSFNLACISGANGAGKSSLLDAITWALFGEARAPGDEAVIHTTCDTAAVMLDFDYESERYRVQRIKTKNKPAILEFFVRAADGSWKPFSERAIRETEARIRQTLRLDYETFTNASFFLQGKADQFAQQRPGDRKRILGSILGLDVWETYRQRAAEQRKQAEAEQSRLDGQIEEVIAELSQEEPRRARLATLEAELQRLGELRAGHEKRLEDVRRRAASLDEQKRLLGMLQSQVEAVNRRLQERENLLGERRAEREELRGVLDAAAEIEQDYARWQEWAAALEQMETRAARFRELDAQRRAPQLALEKARIQLEEERRGLQARQSEAEAAGRELPDAARRAQEARQAASAAQAALDERPLLEAEQADLIARVGQVSAENARLKEDMNALRDRMDSLQDAAGASCPLCGQPLSAEDRERHLKELEAAGIEMGNRFRANAADLTAWETRRREMDRQLAALRQTEADLRKFTALLTQAELKERDLQSRLDEWRQRFEPRLQETQQRLAEGDYAREARAALDELDAVVAALGYDAAAHEAARRAEQEARSSAARFTGLGNARSALAPLEREIAGLESQAAADRQDRDTQSAALQAAVQRYEAEAAGLPDLAQAEEELRRVKEQENDMQVQVGSARQAVHVLKNQRERQVKLTAQREEKAVLIGRLKQLERAFSKDGVPSLLIEQALPEIAEQANKVLERLSDGTMTVSFATQGDFKDKKREDKKEILEIRISDPLGQRAYELFSGGEAFRVNFAIRLALSRVLAQRAGARLQTLVIDEGFGSQDAEGRQRLVQAINMVRDDFAKILVITHLEELKDAFPTRIEVEKTGTGSRVQVMTA